MIWITKMNPVSLIVKISQLETREPRNQSTLRTNNSDDRKSKHFAQTICHDACFPPAECHRRGGERTAGNFNSRDFAARAGIREAYRACIRSSACLSLSPSLSSIVFLVAWYDERVALVFTRLAPIFFFFFIFIPRGNVATPRRSCPADFGSGANAPYLDVAQT